MRVNLQHTHIFASDIEATLRFWQDMFGTQILFDTEIAEARQDSLRRAFVFEDTG
jgi:catechol 2,3-dioxygenase-like lactoylglutathione lyase family enzyme